MQAAATAADVHSRFGLIIAQADHCLAQIRRRERLARRLAAGRRVSS